MEVTEVTFPQSGHIPCNSKLLSTHGLHCIWTASGPNPVSHICHIPKHSCDIADKSRPVPSHGNHPCHFHKISESPGTLVLHSNSEVVKPQPCPSYRLLVTPHQTSGSAELPNPEPINI